MRWINDFPEEKGEIFPEMFRCDLVEAIFATEVGTNRSPNFQAGRPKAIFELVVVGGRGEPAVPRKPPKYGVEGEMPRRKVVLLLRVYRSAPGGAKGGMDLDRIVGELHDLLPPALIIPASGRFTHFFGKALLGRLPTEHHDSL